MTSMGKSNIIFSKRRVNRQPDAEGKTAPELSILSTAKVVSSHSAKVKTSINMETVTIEAEDGINVRTQTDKNICRITGSTMMEGDTILAVADFQNDSVKLIDVRQKRVVSQIRLSRSGWPWDITQVQHDQLAVTLPDPHKVQFLSVSVTGTSLSLGREMKVSGQCHGIDYNNDRLFISFDYLEQVQILSMSGSILKTISTQTDKQIEFHYPYYLTLSVDRSLLYVSDCGTNSLYCLDMNGKVKAIYKDQGLVSPWGVSAAEDGCQIVCGRDSHNVFVISSDCRQGRVLLDKSCGTQAPLSVLYNSALSRLYVGQNNSDWLKVFKLK